MARFDRRRQRHLHVLDGVVLHARGVRVLATTGQGERRGCQQDSKSGNRCLGLMKWPHVCCALSWSLRLHDRDRVANAPLGPASLGPASFFAPGALVLAPCAIRRLAASALRDRPLSSEEHTSELQSLMRISSAVFCLKIKYNNHYT